MLDSPSQPLSFNISHTDGLSVLAVASDGDLGVDAEHKAPLPEALAIAKQHFTSGELDWVKRAEPSTTGTRFLDLWTLKEACSKATGEGLHTSLQAFCFEADASGQLRTAFPTNEGSASWHLWRVHLTATESVAVAWRKPDTQSSRIAPPRLFRAIPGILVQVVDPPLAECSVIGVSS